MYARCFQLPLRYITSNIYRYSGLDTSPAILTPGYDMTWVWWLAAPEHPYQGWSVGPRLVQHAGAKAFETKFARSYTDEISYSKSLKADIVAGYNAQSRGGKFLICS